MENVQCWINSRIAQGSRLHGAIEGRVVYEWVWYLDHERFCIIVWGFKFVKVRSYVVNQIHEKMDQLVAHLSVQLLHFVTA